MNNDKSIYACLYEIKQREINELTEVVRAQGGQYIFPINERPSVLCCPASGPSYVKVGSVEVQDVTDDDHLIVFDVDGNQIMLDDITTGYMEYITAVIPHKTFSKDSFCISRLSREDLEQIGFDASNIDDETMQRIADKLGEDYCEQLFWTSLEIIAEEGFDIPRKNVEDVDFEDDDED